MLDYNYSGSLLPISRRLEDSRMSNQNRNMNSAGIQAVFGHVGSSHSNLQIPVSAPKQVVRGENGPSSNSNFIDFRVQK